MGTADTPAQWLLCLAGIPGSGKSTFSEQLRLQGWAVVNQDTLGDRKACEALCASALHAGRHVVVDRCNFDAVQRAHWVRIARDILGRRARVVALQLLVDPQECRRRAGSRVGHPTIAPHNANQVIARLQSSGHPSHTALIKNLCDYLRGRAAPAACSWPRQPSRDRMLQDFRCVQQDEGFDQLLTIQDPRHLPALLASVLAAAGPAPPPLAVAAAAAPEAPLGPAFFEQQRQQRAGYY